MTTPPEDYGQRLVLPSLSLRNLSKASKNHLTGFSYSMMARAWTVLSERKATLNSTLASDSLPTPTLLIYRSRFCSHGAIRRGIFVTISLTSWSPAPMQQTPALHRRTKHPVGSR